VHDQLNTPSVISLSWGGPESSWSQQAINAINDVAQEASTLGINIFVAAGDSGSSDGVPSGQSTVDFPASSPYVFACGGTRLESGHGPHSETVWNDGGQGGATGGGFSAVFSRPAYQDKGVTGSARGVPDAAGNADPETGYNILVDGQAMVVGGTSAVAPLWAALTCLLMEQFNGKIGFLNSIVYSIDPSSGFRDILHGNNGAYSAGPGWDPCTGLGSPIANKLVEAIARSTGLSVARAGHAGRNEPAAV
jgi:kumamolisin